MPYIEQSLRVGAHALPLAHTPGELSYLVTMLILRYYKEVPPNYQTLNDILGALEGAKLEFYFRIVQPYEEGARKRNQDVYE